MNRSSHDLIIHVGGGRLYTATKKIVCCVQRKRLRSEGLKGDRNFFTYQLFSLLFNLMNPDIGQYELAPQSGSPSAVVSAQGSECAAPQSRRTRLIGTDLSSTTLVGWSSQIDATWVSRIARLYQVGDPFAAIMPKTTTQQIFWPQCCTEWCHMVNKEMRSALSDMWTNTYQ
ncbi:hypothetical protein MP228_012561 [Amoeboaphelidium protococcarum]|nr:hypothetical protein MP228_012561 [Amoeboaphelidium protococcarum]